MHALSYEIIQPEGSSLLWLCRRPIPSLWLHPEIERRINPNFSYRELNRALQDGYLLKCERAPWTYLSAFAQERLLGKVVSSKSFLRLKLGPEKHEAMIHRCLLACRLFMNQATINFDEAIYATSLPGAWASNLQISPDIFICPNVKWLPGIWIECERTLKNARHYKARFERIPKNMLIVYVFSNSHKLNSFKNRLQHLEQSRHIYSYLESDLAFVLNAWARKFQIFSELSYQKFL